jgi:WD40 repeat protein
MKRYCFGLCTFAFLCLSFAWAQTANEFKGHDGLVNSVAISKDGKFLATASADGTVKIWDFTTGKEVQVLKGHTGMVNTVTFNKDASLVVSGGLDKTIRVWNPKDGSKSIKELKGHTDGVMWVAFSPDETILASGGSDKTVRLWDIKDGKELKNLGAHEKSVYCVAFNTAGTELASTGDDGIIKIWDVKAQKEIKSFKVDLPKPLIKKEEKKEEPKKDDKDKKDKKDAKKKDMKKDAPVELRDAFSVIAFTPDGKQVLTAGQDRFLRYWNIADGKEAKKIGPTRDWLFGMTVSSDGKKLATAGYGGSIRVYDLATGARLYPTKDNDAKKDEDNLKAADEGRKQQITYSAVFTPDGRAIITGQHDLKSGKGFAKVTPIMK